MDSFNIKDYFKRGKTVVLTLRQGDEDGIRQWCDKDTNDLIDLMKQYLPEFRIETKRRKDVWEDVSKEMQKTGLCWTSEDCRKKWSNMIRTFRTIEEQRLDPTSNFKRVKWPFYDAIKQLLLLDGSDTLPEAVSVVQLMKGTSAVSSLSNQRNLIQRKTTVFESAEGQRFLSISQRQPHLLPSTSASLTQPLKTKTELFLSDSNLSTNVAYGDMNAMENQTNKQVNAASEEMLRSSAPSAYQFKKKTTPARRSGKQMNTDPDESMDDLFAKFLKTTQKQNTQVLEKITAFHEHALSLMQERNEVLKEIRDAISTNVLTNEGELEHSCHETFANGGTDDTLTLHMGPAYSTSTGSTVNDSIVENTSVTTPLNSTLHMNEQVSANTLTSLELRDGAVLSGLDNTAEKNVLNLESFTESVIPEVALLHPTLVSVVPVTNNAVGNSDDVSNIGLALATSSTGAQ